MQIQLRKKTDQRYSTCIREGLRNLSSIVLCGDEEQLTNSIDGVCSCKTALQSTAAYLPLDEWDGFKEVNQRTKQWNSAALRFLGIFKCKREHFTNNQHCQTCEPSSKPDERSAQI